jgi:hypothetical protein
MLTDHQDVDRPDLREDRVAGQGRRHRLCPAPWHRLTRLTFLKLSSRLPGSCNEAGAPGVAA